LRRFVLFLFRIPSPRPQALIAGHAHLKIRSAALGLVEVNGRCRSLHHSAPITGKPCFLYRTVAWQQRTGKKQEWEKVADETLHLPFFIDDSTGQLLIEPLGSRSRPAPATFAKNTTRRSSR
jgi:hypothetical protein